jgi:chemotaxis protein histidine kinase CheA
MRSTRMQNTWIVASALVLLFAACSEGGPAATADPAQAPAASARPGDGTTAFGASSLSSSNSAPSLNSKTQAVMDNIAGQTQTVKGAVEGLKMANELVAELAKLLAELQAEQPQQGAFEGDPEAYQKALAAHQEKVDKAEQELEQAQKAVAKATASVENAQAELQKLQQSNLPIAQQKDAKAMEQYFEEERKQLEAAQEANAAALEELKTETDAGTDDSVESATKPALGGVPKKGSTLGKIQSSSKGATSQQAASNPLVSGGSAPSGSGLPTDD